MSLVWKHVTQSQCFIEQWAACPVICLSASVVKSAHFPSCSSPWPQALCRICFSSAQRYKDKIDWSPAVWLDVFLWFLITKTLNAKEFVFPGISSLVHDLKESWSGKWSFKWSSFLRSMFCSGLAGNVNPAGVRPEWSQQPLANLDAFCILVLLLNVERRHLNFWRVSVLHMAQNKTAIIYLVATL